ncbi:MAG: ABC transporter ATP-binding protein [Firmicutes bacterium]|nr:ABC transporter ATP-binding protein [Bacillota bacterium]
MNKSPVISVEQLKVSFPVGTGWKKDAIVPVDGVSFSIEEGRVLSLVGESGSGKTTIGRTLMGIVRASGGKIRFYDQDVTRIRGRKLRDHRRRAQMVFQDPYGSLNPVRTVAQHLELPLRRNPQPRNAPISELIDELLTTVGLTPVEVMRVKYPHELSGGQRQRVAIARALAVRPKLLIADEPISMLDVSIRAEILQLLMGLRDTMHLSYLYITHDLASARFFGDRILVLYGGQVMEEADSETLVEDPRHPYTRLLLAASPGSGHVGLLPETSNQSPDLSRSRQGCPFANRCPLVMDICRVERPQRTKITEGHYTSCHAEA